MRARARAAGSTNSSGPPRARGTSPAPARACAVKLRLAEYSLSLSLRHARILRGSLRRRERLFLQGVEGRLLSRRHEARRDARLVRRAAADGGDQQHLLPHAQGDDARELGAHRRRRASASPSRLRAASRTSRGSRPSRRPTRCTTCTGTSRRSATSAARCCSSCRRNLKKDLPRLDGIPRACCRRTTAPPSSSATTAGSTTTSTPRCSAAGAALCLSEREDNAPPPLVETAPWGYVRLRLETYSRRRPASSGRERLAATAWREVYVYFMHEPTAPAYAQTLMQVAA